mmetsp:Transcript_413/g.939  ORF Transcript_413/g.939 Transcript_413/m.939 type:complete len:452 (+) Transcript_413:276-1631(+)
MHLNCLFYCLQQHVCRTQETHQECQARARRKTVSSRNRCGIGSTRRGTHKFGTSAFFAGNIFVGLSTKRVPGADRTQDSVATKGSNVKVVPSNIIAQDWVDLGNLVALDLEGKVFHPNQCSGNDTANLIVRDIDDNLSLRSRSRRQKCWWKISLQTVVGQINVGHSVETLKVGHLSREGIVRSRKACELDQVLDPRGQFATELVVRNIKTLQVDQSREFFWKSSLEVVVGNVEGSEGSSLGNTIDIVEASVIKTHGFEVSGKFNAFKVNLELVSVNLEVDKVGKRPDRSWELALHAIRSKLDSRDGTVFVAINTVPGAEILAFVPVVAGLPLAQGSSSLFKDFLENFAFIRLGSSRSGVDANFDFFGSQWNNSGRIVGITTALTKVAGNSQKVVLLLLGVLARNASVVRVLAATTVVVSSRRTQNGIATIGTDSSRHPRVIGHIAQALVNF